MPLRLREICLQLDEDESLLPDKIAAILGLEAAQIESWTIIRKAIDARRKTGILRVYTVEFCCADEIRLLERHRQLTTLLLAPEKKDFTWSRLTSPVRVMIVGMGPAGLFSALALAHAGAQVHLVERGRDVTERLRDVNHFWAGGELKPESNIQFGEGGAGTFSDGKLTCRLNHPESRFVLEQLVAFGAPEDILRQAKPHIGSDRLRRVVLNIRKELLALGVEIRFSACLTGIDCANGRVRAGIVNHSEEILCDQLILATGHSARDTYKMLAHKDVLLEQKPFAVGLRVEHPIELINRIQYGKNVHTRLPAADYRLAWNDSATGRGVYSFCMCPGGWVVNAASEPGGLVVNGMSDFRRDGDWSNSALVVSVTPKDFPGDDALAGVRFQRLWEQAAYRAGGENWHAPAQPLLEYLNGKGGRLNSSCRPAVAHADLKNCLPKFVDAGLRKALPYFNQCMRGFVGPEAVLIGVETRTSSPVRIVRDRFGESVSHKGMFPVGEGAGYAGGIMSAALDGLTIAGNIIQRSNANQ